MPKFCFLSVKSVNPLEFGQVCVRVLTSVVRLDTFIVEELDRLPLPY